MDVPKLLLITRNAWSNNISTGNTMSNFFSDWKYDIANLFCRDEEIDNCICTKYFRITEKELINSIFKKKDVGKSIIFKKKSISSCDIDKKNIESEKKKYTFFRKYRLQIFLWLREIIWKCGKWKNNNLNEFIDEYSPNLIFIPLYDCWYMYDILFYLYKRTNAKIVIYTGDDMYTLKQFSLSPLYWIDRLIRRKKIKHAIDISSMRFCLTQKQSDEYTKIFGKKFDTIMKSAICESNSSKLCKPIQMVYTGNIYPGRYKTLAKIADAVEKINNNEIKIQFEIYSGNALKNSISKLFKKKGVLFCGSISSAEVEKKQAESDIVVHAENFSLVSKLKVRLSFSTKIVDYLSHGKCIFAVGPNDIASIEYLKKNNAAVVVTDRTQITNALYNLVSNQNLIKEFGENAKYCCMKNHNKEKNHNKLYKRLEEMISKDITN